MRRGAGPAETLGLPGEPSGRVQRFLWDTLACLGRGAFCRPMPQPAPLCVALEPDWTGMNGWRSVLPEGLADTHCASWSSPLSGVSDQLAFQLPLDSHKRSVKPAPRVCV